MATQEEYDWLISRLKERADNGDTAAMKNLGDAYFQGKSGKEKNYSAAFPYWKSAADHGELSVAGKVGGAMIFGIGCAKDVRGAIPYLTKGADYGDAMAQYQLGLCYESGNGCAENHQLAIKYYRMSALQNLPDAQYRLGLLLFMNKDTEYLHWVCCAHINGVNDATDLLNEWVQNNPSFRETIDWQINKIKEKGIKPESTSSSTSSSSSEGCYVATAVYGSYDCPQVWTLRRYRDNDLASTWHGRAFIRAYYAISPTIVKYFGNATIFQNFWRKRLDKLVKRLHDRGIEETPYCDKEY